MKSSDTTSKAFLNEMVIDTSAIFSVITQEPDALLIRFALADSQRRLVSAVTLVEASLALEGRFGAQAALILDSFLGVIQAEIVSFTEEHGQLARMAFRQFGKGRHKASLNFGDCCVYALARASGEPILCKGNDFAQTDIAVVAFAR